MEIGTAYARTSQEKDDAFFLDSQLKAIRAFAREQEIQIPEAYELKLSAQLGGMTIGDEFISELTEFAQTIGDDLETLPFEERRRIIEHLGIRGEITVEDGEKVIYITWYTHTIRRNVTVFPSSSDSGERYL